MDLSASRQKKNIGSGAGRQKGLRQFYFSIHFLSFSTEGHLLMGELLLRQPSFPSAPPVTSNGNLIFGICTALHTEECNKVKHNTIKMDL